MISFLCLAGGIFVGMWVRNQLNEDKNPLVTIKDAIIRVFTFFRDEWNYTMKKIPKKKKTVIHGNDDNNMGVGA